MGETEERPRGIFQQLLTFFTSPYSIFTLVGIVIFTRLLCFAISGVNVIL